MFEIDVGDLERDRLGGPQPGRVHELEQRPVPQRHLIVPPRLSEQSLHLGIAQDLRELLAATRRLQTGGRVVLNRFLPAQMPVEGAQARRLAMDRRRRAGRSAVPVSLRELREEVREIARPRVGGVSLAFGQEPAELEQVRPVGRERVAGETALELEMREEVEDQALIALGCLRLRSPTRGGRNRRHTQYFSARRRVPASMRGCSAGATRLRSSAPSASSARSATWRPRSARSRPRARPAGSPPPRSALPATAGWARGRAPSPGRARRARS